jgi:hypothetical protein
MSRTAILAGFLVMPFFTARAAAQNLPTPDAQQESQTPEAEKRKRAAAEAAAAQARQREAPGETATYAQVLANPDDTQLNYRFARAQIRAGDLKGAAATLERILLINPDLADVRLLYAVVLYRLDDLSEAKRELETLQKAALTPAEKKERDEYAASVDGRMKKTHLSGRLSAGFEYDSNRNASPSTGLLLFQGQPLPVSGLSAQRDDTAILTQANVTASRDLAHGNEVFTSLDYYRADQTLLKTLNLQAYSAQVGGVWRAAPGWNVTPTLGFDHVLLGEATFLRDRSAGVRVDHDINRRTTVFAEVHDAFDDFVNTSEVPNIGDETGIRFDATLGVERVLTPNMKLTASYTHEIKHAAQDFWEYQRESVDLAHLWLLGKGTFLLTSAALHYDRYEQPNPLLSQTLRDDKTLRAGITYGVPLDVVCPKLKDFLATFNYEYFQALSTVENYAYTNNKVSGLVTYRWELGL